MAMEHTLFTGDFRIETPISRGFPVATFDYWSATTILWLDGDFSAVESCVFCHDLKKGAKIGFEVTMYQIWAQKGPT